MDGTTLVSFLVPSVLGLVLIQPASSGGHQNTILPTHFAGYWGLPQPAIRMPIMPIGNRALGGIRRRAGQLAALLEDSNKRSFLTPVVKRLAANLIQKMMMRKTEVAAPQRSAQTTTIVTEERRPLLHLDAHSQLHLNDVPHVHVNADPHVHLMGNALFDLPSLRGLTSSNLFGDSLTNIIVPQPQNQYHVDIVQPAFIPQPVMQPILQPIYQPPQIIHQPHYIDRPVIKEVIKEVVKPVIKEVVKQPTIIKQYIPAPVQTVVPLRPIAPVQQVPIRQIPIQHAPIQQHITRHVPVQQIQQVQQTIVPHQQRKIWSVKGGKK